MGIIIDSDGARPDPQAEMREARERELFEAIGRFTVAWADLVSTLATGIDRLDRLAPMLGMQQSVTEDVKDLSLPFRRNLAKFFSLVGQRTPESEELKNVLSNQQLLLRCEQISQSFAIGRAAIPIGSTKVEVIKLSLGYDHEPIDGTTAEHLFDFAQRLNSMNMHIGYAMMVASRPPIQ
ncbi:hypothetical protein [Sphingomonas montanisoli]|uniref:Uncharacterized protein n=1 Tax=Sphingomonas montanisoli TaxID=2606412 RepID=A0A5D9C3L9_9SPHN|nr:hypothetical protein [Sphingomonas montanisoli]TZG25882.1 hypothetical protein FYJ91_12950 [Sphingomonas montanisoli]